MYKCNGIYCMSCNPYLAISHDPYHGFRPTTLNHILLCDIMHPHCNLYNMYIYYLN